MSAFEPRNPSVPIGPANPVVPIETKGTVTPDPSNRYTADQPAPLYQSYWNDLYNGDYGLGQQYAWAKTVRPYRSLISAQAIYRREVFQ